MKKSSIYQIIGRKRDILAWRGVVSFLLIRFRTVAKGVVSAKKMAKKRLNKIFFGLKFNFLYLSLSYI